jgi:archaellum component FlaF (FlaF/FlaG flagellin family)
MIVAMVLMGCLLMAVPAMATTVGAQTADDDESFAFDATLDNETATVSVTSNDTAVENATIAVNSTEEGTTDADGTLQFGLDNRSAVEIGVTVDNTTQTTTYEVVDGSLVEQTENTDDSTEFAFDATLDNETVTVAVTSNETAVENATVAVNGTEAGTTDANGTLQFGLENRSAVEIAVTVDDTTQSTTYDVVEGELVEQETESTTEFASDVTLDNGTVTVSVTSNGTTVENAAVAVNGTEVGPTDANGTLQFPLENRPAVEIAVTVDETTQTTTYVVVGGELITQQSAADAQEVPEEAADQVSTIQKLISAFRNGEFEKLGPIVSEAAGRGPPADAGNGSGNAPEDAGNGQGNAPENAGNGQGNAPENAGNGQGNAPENAGNGQGNAPENASNGQGNAPENAGNGQGNGGSGGNSGNQGNGGSGGNGNSGGNSGNGGNGQGGGPPASITLSR